GAARLPVARQGAQAVPGTPRSSHRRHAGGDIVATVKRDYYEVLGVERRATAAELKTAYRKLAMEFHPDRNQGDKQAEERFKEVGEAYAVLSDPQKRQRYDAFRHSGNGMPDLR